MPILELNPSNPLVDGRQSETALSIRQGVMRHFAELGFSLLPELTLASGRRADLIGIDRNCRITIIEIKSSIEDFRVDSKWQEYREFCDCFYFATAPHVPQEIFPEAEGLFVADRYGAEMIRDSLETKLSAARRKALLLRFARAASNRLERVTAHAQASGAALPADVSSINGE